MFCLQRFLPLEVAAFEPDPKLTASSALLRDSRIVLGYHGTSIERAQTILLSGQFIPSENDYDWLGHGVYFWEYAPIRAWQWARQMYRDRGAVVEAEIELGFCLDLTDSRYTKALKLAYDRIREAYANDRKPLPENKHKANRLDCLVINYLVQEIIVECDTVRAPFLEGEPVYKGSMLLTQSHIQLVVRDVSCIRKFRQLESEVADG